MTHHRFFSFLSCESIAWLTVRKYLIDEDRGQHPSELTGNVWGVQSGLMACGQEVEQ